MKWTFKKYICMLSMLAIAVFIVKACGGAGPSSPPIIPVSIESLDGEADVGVDNSFSYEFEKDVDFSTVTEDTFFLVPTPAEDSISSPFKAAIDPTICNPESENKVDATRSQASSKKVNFTPTANLSYGTSYTFCLTTSIIHDDGTAFEGFSATFITETNPLPITTPPTISSVKDAKSTPNTISATGSTGIFPSYFDITFSEAMAGTSITTAGNITLTCGSASPTITITRSADNTAHVAVTDAYKYALIECTLTVTTNVTNSGGTAIASNATYVFTNGCALDDDFNADSQSCWTVGDLTTPWANWNELINGVGATGGILTFNTTDSTLDYNATAIAEANAVEVYKDATISDTSNFEIIIHFKSIEGYNVAPLAAGPDDEAAVLHLENVGDSKASQDILFGIHDQGMSQDCYLDYYYDGNYVGQTTGTCPAGSEYYVKFGISGTTLVMQYSTNGTTYTDFGVIGALDAAIIAGRFTDTVRLTLLFSDLQKTLTKRAHIEAITSTGLSSTTQY